MKLEIFFENQTEIIKRELRNAKVSVHIAVAWLNFDKFNTVFLELLEMKVSVNIVCSSNSSNLRYINIIKYLRVCGAKITLLEMPNLKNHMHHKFCIIDNEKILNGSFNWSENAIKSFENLMVISDDINSARKFVNEFKRLQLIETQSIRKLQRTKKCKDKECSGELINILVYAENSSKYGELTGDLVQTCNICRSYTALSSDITSQQLDLYLEEYRSADSDDAEYELYKYIQDELSSYMNNETIVHAIGRVERKLIKRSDEEIGTRILWTNVFAGNKVPDYFDDETFDVYYDSVSYF